MLTGNLQAISLQLMGYYYLVVHACTQNGQVGLKHLVHILGDGHTHFVCIMCVACHCSGREYETRNFSYDDVNYHNSNRISKVQLLLKFGAFIQNISCLHFKITSWLWQLILFGTF